MAYTTITLADAQAALALRLDDAASVHWTVNEQYDRIREALRVWNALTSHFRDTAVFQTAYGQAFYDLPTVIPTLRGQTVTVQDLLATIEYDLIEVQSTGSTWNGTAQFSLDDLTEAISRRRDQFLRETNSVLTRSILPISSPPDGRINLPDTIIAIRRAAWVASNTMVTPLRRDDEWSFVAYAPGWVQKPGRPPITYSVAATPPLIIQVAPPPLDTGQLDLITISRGPDITTAGLDTDELLGVPDDLAWVIACGALADLLSRDGLALDLQRASYFQARWNHGITFAQSSPVVLTTRINNVALQPAGLGDADVYSPNWQSIVGQPRRVLTAGQTLLGLWPPPGVPIAGGNYSCTLDVVRNAPIPVIAADYLQIGPELLDTLLDYAQHRCLCKEGPGQLQQSIPLLNSFMAAAGTAVTLQAAQQPNRRPLVEQQLQDSRQVAVQIPVESTT